MTTESDFLAEHGGELRMTLIMIEGEDGGFRLLDHWCLTRPDGSQLLAVVVQSTNTERHYTMLHDDTSGRGHHFRWHEASAQELWQLRQNAERIQSSRPGAGYRG